MGIIAFLGTIALLVAVSAYPLVRGLTRRIERLQAGVEQLGGGDLKARVEVKGRDEVALLAASFNRAAERIEQLVGAHKMLLANASLIWLIMRERELQEKMLEQHMHGLPPPGEWPR